MLTDEEVLRDAEALLAEYAPPHQQAGDLTVAMVMDRWTCGQLKALKGLAQMVKDKKVKVVEGCILANGKRGRVWRPIKKGKK